MRNGWRIAGVVGCCALAAISPFIAGAGSATVGVLLLAGAIVLVARSSWSAPTRIVAVVVVLAATFGLTIALLILASSASGD